MQPPPPPSPLQDRLAALTPRERGFVLSGIIALLVFFIYLATRGEPDAAPPVELAATPPVAAAPVLAGPILPVSPPAAPPSTLTLHGIFLGGPGGGAAVIDAGGGQRMVRAGRPVSPTVSLQTVARDHVILLVGGAPMRLAFGKGAEPASVSTTAAGPADSTTLDYRLGLKPAGAGGYQVTPGARLPLLEAAGLRPGDVITRVNGSQLDEERLLELAWQGANSGRLEFDYVRDGKAMTGSVDRGQQVTVR